MAPVFLSSELCKNIEMVQFRNYTEYKKQCLPQCAFLNLL